MALYEHVFIARQDVSTSQVEAITAEFSKIVEERDGKVAKNEYWGLKNLAYKIKKNRKGHYVLLNIEGSSDAINEIERQARLNEDVIRYMTIRVDEHEEGQSIVLRSKADKDRRGPRGDDRRPRGDDRRPPRNDSDDRRPPRSDSKE